MTELRAATFAPHTGTTFTVTGWWDPGASEPPAEADAPLSIELTLTEVEQGPVGERFDQFSLTLEGPREQPLDQGTYRIEHPAVDLEGLFLVPFEESGSVRRYGCYLSVPAPSDQRMDA